MTALKVSHVSKSFPGVKALDNVSMTLTGGSVHALLGENGAGKSTLIKIMTGIHAADSGEITMEGRPVRFANPRQAAAGGLGVAAMLIVKACPPVPAPAGKPDDAAPVVVKPAEAKPVDAPAPAPVPVVVPAVEPAPALERDPAARQPRRPRLCRPGRLCTG